MKWRRRIPFIGRAARRPRRGAPVPQRLHPADHLLDTVWCDALDCAAAAEPAPRRRVVEQAPPRGRAARPRRPAGTSTPSTPSSMSRRGPSVSAATTGLARRHGLEHGQAEGLGVRRVHDHVGPRHDVVACSGGRTSPGMTSRSPSPCRAHERLRAGASRPRPGRPDRTSRRRAFGTAPPGARGIRRSRPGPSWAPRGRTSRPRGRRSGCPKASPATRGVATPALRATMSTPGITTDHGTPGTASSAPRAPGEVNTMCAGGSRCSRRATARSERGPGLQRRVDVPDHRRPRNAGRRGRVEQGRVLAGVDERRCPLGGRRRAGRVPASSDCAASAAASAGSCRRRCPWPAPARAIGPGDKHARAGTNRARSTPSMISLKTVDAPPRSS